MQLNLFEKCDYGNPQKQAVNVQRRVRQYREIKPGEIILATDEYISVFSNGEYGPVKECSVGKELLECNAKYYRRPK